MANARTKIEWTDCTWNVVTGCTKVSQGCKHCYAENNANRFFTVLYPPNTDGTPRKFTDVRCHEDRLDQPLHWKKPRRIFTNSMSDLFHEDVPFEFIDKVFAVMACSWRHTFQVLTKRPGRMLEYMLRMADKPSDKLADAACDDCWEDESICALENFVNGWSRWRGMSDSNPLDGTVPRWPLPNVWLGVSVEDQATADERIPLLLQTPTAVRWVSYEPALGPVTFDGYLANHEWENGVPGGVNWLVCGGESGPGARPCNTEWIRGAVKQCKAAGVPCFVKQLGSQPLQPRDGDLPIHMMLRDRKGGIMCEWPTDLQIRQYPKSGNQ